MLRDYVDGQVVSFFKQQRNRDLGSDALLVSDNHFRKHVNNRHSKKQLKWQLRLICIYLW